MPNEPRWLPIEVVIRYNQSLVKDTGETHFLRDQGALESACARPQNHFAYGECDVIRLAVALAVGIARSHAFEQGNKRTAFASAAAFIRLNGFIFEPDAEHIGQVLTAVVTNESSEDILELVLWKYARPATG